MPRPKPPMLRERVLREKWVKAGSLAEQGMIRVSPRGEIVTRGGGRKRVNWKLLERVPKTKVELKSRRSQLAKNKREADLTGSLIRSIGRYYKRFLRATAEDFERLEEIGRKRTVVGYSQFKVMKMSGKITSPVLFALDELMGSMRLMANHNDLRRETAEHVADLERIAALHAIEKQAIESEANVISTLLSQGHSPSVRQLSAFYKVYNNRAAINAEAKAMKSRLAAQTRAANGKIERLMRESSASAKSGASQGKNGSRKRKSKKKK